MRITIFVHNRNDNALGRAYVFWLLCKHLGWQCSVVTERLAPIWGPLRNTAFADNCVSGPTSEAAIKGADLLISLKPWPGSLGYAIEAAHRYEKQLLVDIDDPDYEAKFGDLSSPVHAVRVAFSMVRRGISPFEFRRLRIAASDYPIIISNPCLRRWYSGTVVPHVREPVDVKGRESRKGHGTSFRVAFVGTPRRSKGLDVLRRATARLEGTELVITGRAPRRAGTGEKWVGQLAFQEAQELLESADVAVVPSLCKGYSFGQFPVKILDAFSLGCPVVASRVGPIPWVVEDAGVLVEPGNVEGLSRVLMELRDDEQLRAELAGRGLQRLREVFSPTAIAPVFATITKSLIE